MLPARVAAALMLAVAGAAHGQQDTQQIIDGIKDLQGNLGLKPTGNFSDHSTHLRAFYRCYYTGKLELPASYDDLRLIQGNEAGCAVDEKEYDVFFYPIEAVANSKAPVTASLGEASPERIAVVVAHEDFHEQKPIRRLPPRLAEAAATLIGFLTAAEFAKNQQLAQEAEIFQRKSAVVNRYYVEVAAVYAAARAGGLRQGEALASKQRLFGQLDDECHAALPDAASFNKCLPANNNAGLAFDYTYTRYYPLLYDVYLAHGKQLQATIEAISRAPAQRSLSEAAAVAYFQDLIRRR